MNSKTQSVIMRAGAVVISTMTSFLVRPPVLSPDEISIINWKNIFTFIAGIVSILLYDEFKKRRNTKAIVYWLSGAFVSLLVAYAYLYRRFSCSCYTFHVIISEAPVKKEIATKAASWTGPNRISQLAEAFQCKSGSIWDDSNLLGQYYAMIVIYLAGVVILTVLLVTLAELLKSQRNA